MSFSNMVTQSILMRALAIFILAAVMGCALAIATVDYILGRAIPADISTILWVGVGYATTILGVNLGIVLQPAKNATTPELPPTAEKTA